MLSQTSEDPSHVTGRIVRISAFTLLTFSSLLPCTVSPAQQPAGPRVTIASGQLQGIGLPATGGAAFKGIPFAQPPVGDLRWREPEPVKPWTGVRQAVEYGAPCAQSGSGWKKVVNIDSSEDCLYLNLWTPEWPAKGKHPVMLFLYGGGNSSGSAIGAGGIEPVFDGASLARHGVILVTINYRLGLFGFMGHPELTAESPHHASGNYGILDTIAALQWVHDNIAKFGGDPANVTLFGQSAGARDTDAMVTSPLAKGLLQKAIAESGSPMSNDRRLLPQSKVEQLGTVVAEAVKAPATNQIAYLRSLSTKEVLAAQQQIPAKLKQAGLTIDVNVDGYALTQSALDAYRAGKEQRIPMIFGSNGRDNVSQRAAQADDTPEIRQAVVKTMLDNFYGKYPDLRSRAEALYSADAVSTYPPYGTVDVQLGSDIAIRCATTVIVGWHSAVAPTYEYAFDAGTPSHPPFHSAELAYVFGDLRDQASEPNLVKLSDQMEQYWTNFAKTGDPNGPGLPKWPKYDAKGKQYIHFSNEGIDQQAALRPGPCGVFAERLNRELDASR